MKRIKPTSKDISGNGRDGDIVIGYKGYTIRTIPQTKIIMAIPSSVLSIYYPYGGGETKEEALKQVKIMIDDLLKRAHKR